MSNFVSYENAQSLMAGIAAKFANLNGADAAILEDLADPFNAANAYAIGDVVTKDNDLYKFKVAHTAGDPWDATEVDAVDMLDLLADTASNISLIQSNNIADEFVAANAYAIGDIVAHNGLIYKFKAAHTAGDPWSDSEVDQVRVEDLVEDAEPDELTTAQVTALIGLLD